MGEICKFYELATNEKEKQEECLGMIEGPNGDYKSNPDFFIDAAGFRYVGFMMALYMPVGCIFVELFCNQLWISWKQLPLQYLFTCFYALATLMYQKFSSGTCIIFPDKLDWNANVEDIFSNCIAWFLVFAAVQTGSFVLILGIHNLKSQFICK